MEIDGIYKTTRYALSDLVEVITSNDDGVAVSSSLPLGKYMVRELAAPDHYTADTEESWEVELKYKDQFTPLVWQQVNSKNNYFQVELDLQKHFETGYNTEQYIPGGGAVFGLFNAEPILYGKKSLPEDTLIDTVTVDGSGHALYRLKIPAGIYYLKELSTRTGYVIEDTPFYFAVGDIKSAPFEISKEKEGEDKDGITAKVVQDGFGAARLTIEVLKRYPTAQITVNGTTYVLDKNYAAENVAICTDPDMSRITVTASEEKPVQIILPNKKPLNITVKGNSYQWAYDGKEGTSVLPVAYTGYCADYTFKEQEDHNITLYDHQKTSGIIMKTFYEGEDEKRQKITELTAIEGQYISLWRNGEQLDLSEMVLPIRLKPEESLKIKMANYGIYTIYFNKDKTLEISISNVVKDILTEENGPSLTIDGQKAALNIYKNVTATRQDSGARSVQIKINSMDDTFSMPIQNKVGNTPEEPDIPWTPLPNKHYLQIIKSDKETGSPLMGAEFEIWSSKRTEKNGEYVPDKVLYTATTNAEGMIYFEVDAEEVLFCHEIKAPDGYIIDDRFHQINMKKDLTITNLHLHNEKATGALQLLKTDANSGKPLAFAGFHIFDTEGNIVFEGYTDEKGSIYCDALPIGTYWYQEFHAPKGYVIDHEKYSFTVNRNGQVVKVKAENQRKEIPQKPQEKDGTPPVPKTGDNRQIVFYFILLLLSVTILSLFLAYCRKKEEKRLRE